MKKLKLEGDNTTQTLYLQGDPKNPEPVEVRIHLPGGYISVVRCSTGTGKTPDYWVHAGVFHPDHPDAHRVHNLTEHGDPGPTATITDARIDRFDQHASATRELAADLLAPNVDHVAVRITPTRSPNP